MTSWLDFACTLATPFFMPPSPSASVAATTSNFSDPSVGSIDYRLVLPPQGSAVKALPLVVMLHGHSQDLDGFIAGTGMNEAAADAGFAVLYPAQSPKSHPQRCWNWFDPDHQRRGRGEPALLAALTRSVVKTHRIDARRVHVAGLSAGGAMAAVMGREYPELFAGVGVHSGLATGLAHGVGSALASMRGELPMADGSSVAMPTIVFHGDDDKVVHVDNGERVVVSCTGGTHAVEEQRLVVNERTCTRRLHRRADGAVLAEHWIVHDAGHAWSGGSTRGSFADAHGPDASAEMLRFFAGHRR